MSRSSVGLQQSTDDEFVSNLKGFLDENGLAETRCLSALRLGNKFLKVESEMKLDICGLLMFCSLQFWKVKIGDLPVMVQKLLSDKTLMALAERNKGWFLKAAASYRSMMIPVFPSRA